MRNRPPAARHEISAGLSDGIESITVNGARASRPDMLLDAISRMDVEQLRHGRYGNRNAGYVTTRYHVVAVTPQGSRVLDLGHDSKDSRKYWVFYAGFDATNNDPPGAVFTDALDGIWERVTVRGQSSRDRRRSAGVPPFVPLRDCL